MLKYVLLSGAMALAMPAFAQTQSMPAPTAPVTGAQPAQTDTATVQGAPRTATGGRMATEALPPSEPQVAQTAPATPAIPADGVAAPTSKAEQVAAVVGTEFPTYDKNADGKLSNAEFGAWMVALKTASDPSTKADSAAIKTWVGGAFASADTDKNKSVTKEELAGFLSKG